MMDSLRLGIQTYLCISDADTLSHFQSNITNPANAIEIKNLVLVNNTTRALHGGSLAFADFQLTPPFGSNMFEINYRESYDRKGCVGKIDL